MQDYNKISVKFFVEQLLRHGDIKTGSGIVLPERAQLGTKIHNRIQQKKKNERENYQCEKTVIYTVENEDHDLDFVIEGRIDGFYKSERKMYVEEYKTVSSVPEEYEIIHMAQGIIYGYILLTSDEEVTDLSVTVEYHTLKGDTHSDFNKTMTRKEVYDYFDSLKDRYTAFLKYRKNHFGKIIKQTDLFSFPHGNFRSGQRDLAAAVYKTINESDFTENNISVCEAPTGIGKTSATLFPAVLSLSGLGPSGKIFYLTGRNEAQKAPLDTMNLFSDQLTELITVNICGKEKVCPYGCSLKCDSSVCDKAKGHYDRVNDALKYALESEYRIFDRNRISETANTYNICPFEFSLDLSLFAEVIICDYNYVFDPKAKLKRYFDGDINPYIFLIDEVHNLPDRVREMYTAPLDSGSFYNAYYSSKQTASGKHCRDIADILVAIADNMKSDFTVTDEIYSRIPEEIEKFCKSVSDRILRQKEITDEIIDAWFKAMFFSEMSEYATSERFRITQKKSFSGKGKISGELTVFCVDSSEIIYDTLKKGRSAFLFSGTVSPYDEYFRHRLGTEKNRFIRIKSPFNPENLLVKADVSLETKYYARQDSYRIIAENLKLFTQKIKSGNYIVFFSSYSYLDNVLEVIDEETGQYIFKEPQNGTMEEKRIFYNDFTDNPDKLRIGFCVLGGSFSEGIDLPGKRLSGVIIIGTGIPKVCDETNVIKNTYDNLYNGNGFMFAYLYPGISKIIQAAGRVIRTDTDRGFVVIADKRYISPSYRKLLPSQWNYGISMNKKEIINEIFDFLEEK